MAICKHITRLLVAILVATPVWAQSQTPAPRTPPAPAQPRTPPATAPAATPPAPRPRATRPRTPATQKVIVRDVSGTPLADVAIAVSGPASSRLTSDAAGSADVMLADGSYRIRFEHDGYVTLDHDVTIRNGQPAELDIVLSLAPPPPPPPPPPPAPKPEPPPTPARQVPPGPPTHVSIPMFLDKNFIGRDPLKESVLACTPDAMARLLQLRDPIAAHTHADLDEVLYVVAGEGAVRIGEAVTPLAPGSLSVIPRGLAHSIERRGRNPLILLSMLAGAPCPNVPEQSRK